MKIIVKDFDNNCHELVAEEGLSLMEIIVANKLPMLASCAGNCSCATCHVLICDNWLDKLPEIEEEEENMLDMMFEREKNSRLACQIIFNRKLSSLKLSLIKDSE